MHADDAIRPAAPADLPSLPGIELAAARQFLATAIRGDFLGEVTSLAALVDSQERGRLFVAVHRGQCVGFARGDLLEDGEAWLDELDVHPDHGRRGIGRALVERIASWAVGCGAATLGLSTFRDVAWNAPFYARAGFRELVPGEWSAAHRAIVDGERQRGLPVELRVVMRRELAGR